MSDLPEYKGGDTIKQTVIVKSKKTGSPINIPTDGTVAIKAYIIEPKRRKVIIPSIDILHTDQGNDWLNGEVYIEFSNASSVGLNDYDQQEVLLALRIIKESKPKTITSPAKAVKMPLNIT